MGKRSGGYLEKQSRKACKLTIHLDDQQILGKLDMYQKVMNCQIPLKIRLQVKRDFLILKINEKPTGKFECAIELELVESWQ